jgi:hypothetical protein
MPTIQVSIGESKELLPALFKSGSSNSWITSRAAKECQLKIEPLAEGRIVLDEFTKKPLMANELAGIAHVKMNIAGNNMEMDMIVVIDELSDFSLALGMDFVSQFASYMLDSKLFIEFVGEKGQSFKVPYTIGAGCLGGFKLVHV